MSDCVGLFACAHCSTCVPVHVSYEHFDSTSNRHLAPATRNLRVVSVQALRRTHHCADREWAAMDDEEALLYGDDEPAANTAGTIACGTSRSDAHTSQNPTQQSS
jgi:Fe-S oxidoreductase